MADEAKFCPGCGQPAAARAPNLSKSFSKAAEKLQTQVPSLLRSSGGPSGLSKWLPTSITRWDIAALAGGAAGAGIWYAWSKLVVPDKTTPLLILLMPVLIVFLRKPLDRLLMPIQKFKQKIPRLILIGVGLALPYLVANYLYNHGVSNYPLARKSIVWGTLLGYLVLRIPNAQSFAGKGPGGLLSAAKISSWVWLLGLAVFGVILFMAVDPALADHFKQTGYKDLEDGLRTPGWAQTIAGTGGAVIDGLVNGALIFQQNIPPPPGSAAAQPGGGGGDQKGDQKKEEPIRYTMDVRTEEQRTSLAADDTDRLWVMAQLSCSKPGVKSETLTKPISFSFSGQYASWLSIKKTKFDQGYKGVLLAAGPPTPEAELGEEAKFTVTVSGATLDGEPINVPVQIELEEELRLKVTVLA